LRLASAKFPFCMRRCGAIPSWYSTLPTHGEAFPKNG
jgi:endogenous inhibitor of DNA gyrase (YacG/DUF329 family)